MKRYKPENDKIIYKRKLEKSRQPVPTEQTIPDRSKYDRKKNKSIIEKDIDND